MSGTKLEKRMGGESSITPPSTRKNEGETGSEDTIEMGLNVRWEHWEELKELLESAREKALANGDEVVLEVHGNEFIMKPRGSGVGISYAKYVLESNGIEFSIADREQGTELVMNVRVRAGSLICMYWKTTGIWEHVCFYVRLLGGMILGNKLSRIDPCVDLPGADILEFVQANHEGRFVTRARDIQEYYKNRKANAVYVGKGAIMVRMYEKAIETKRKGSKWEYLCRYRFGNKNPEMAVRVEIQLRREALKELGVNTIQEYEAKKAAIIRYVLTEWLRMSANEVDRENRNQDKVEIAYIWNQVIEAFEQWAGKTQQVVRRIRKCAAEFDGLIRQALGCLRSAQVLDTGAIVDEPKQFLADAFVAVSKWCETQPGDFWSTMADRSMKQAIKKRRCWVEDDGVPFRWHDTELQFDFDWNTGEFGVVRG